MTAVSSIRVHTAHGNSFDHLVGERQQFIRHVEAERFRRPEVYDHLELGRQQHRQVGRLVTPKDATGIAASQAIHLGQVRPIGDEAAGAGEFRCTYIVGTA
jgi:hypothetical protein